ncbi:MAG: hypothetical protein ALAOOOJD_04725 [bacterium]|nr:hypothetical protein [bacterium]
MRLTKADRLPPRRLDEDAALRSILEGTAAQTGKRFFVALVKNLAKALNTYGAWVTEYIEESHRLRAHALWLGGKLIRDYEFRIEGTPCELVITGRQSVHCENNLLKLFPNDGDLRKIGAVSYMGVPLLDVDGKVLGHLAVLDTQPMPQEPRASSVFRIFAARAAAELQRHRIELELQKKNAALEKAQALLEAENRRKSVEIERARQLQLSMLPAKIPHVPHLEIAAYMKTATEVGGDYYDFNTGRDGVLTMTIGDATGHGLNAGMMVTATKSILTTLHDEMDLPEIFQRLHRALQRVNLRRHYMALQMLRITGAAIEVCAAGMPPLLLYRAAEKRVEEIAIKALPLGSAAQFNYRKKKTTLAPGDTILLMSDGLLELFNPQNEIFDYERMRTAFAEAASQAPREIIKHLVQRGETWASGRPQEDDVTLVVLQAK